MAWSPSRRSVRSADDLRWIPTGAERVAARRYLLRWRWRGAGLLAITVAVAAVLAATDDVAPWLWPSVFLLVASSLLWMVWRAPAVQVQREGPAPEVQLSAGPEGLRHREGEREAQLPWRAVAGLVDRPEGTFLHLASGGAVFVPARVRPSGYAAQLAAWRAGGAPSDAPAATAPAGRDRYVVRFRATSADYAAYVLRVESRRQPVWWPVAAGALVVVAAAADRGLDVVTLAAVSLWTGALVVSGAARRALARWMVPMQVARALRRHPERLPTGPVAVGLGPDGGWVASDGSVGRFAWPDVRAVEEVEGALVLQFGGELGLVLPARVLAAVEGSAELVADVRRWREAAGTGPRPPGDRGVVPDETPSPFAPPVGS